ncbi:MAG: MFS transporter [Armatimonadetes bacterium]|nr:MFS transporter [Armatimonadota bacterium]
MSQPAPQPAPMDAPAVQAPRATPQDVGWLAAVLPVILIAACAELGISVLNNSALPIYFTRGLHLSTRAYGVIMAMFFVSEVLFKSPLGALADRFGRRPVMLGGAAVTVFTPVLLLSMHYDPASATAAAVLVGFGFLRALDGLGEAALWPSLYAYVGDVVAEAKRGAAMGVLNLVYMVGIAFSFLAGGAADDTFGPVLAHQATFGQQMHHAFQNTGHAVQHAIQHTGHAIQNAGHHVAGALRHPHAPHLPPHQAAPPQQITVAPPPSPDRQPEYYYPSFYLTAFLFAVAVVSGLFLRAKVRTQPGDAGHQPDESITWAGFVAALRVAPQFLLLAFVMFAGIGCISLLVKKFALDEFGITETAFGQLVLGPALVIGLVAVPAGRLADRWGKGRSVQLGFGLAAIGLWGIPILHHVFRGDLTTGKTAFILAAMVMGIGSVLAFPAWLALLTSLCEDRQRGTVFGAVSTAQGVGALVGALAGTALYDVRHLAPFVAAAALVTLGALLALVFVRDRPAPPARAGVG